MKIVRYVGPLVHLQGQTALMREDGAVQFDNTRLTRSGNPVEKVLVYEPHARFPTEECPGKPTQDQIGFGWHVFDKTTLNSF